MWAVAAYEQTPGTTAAEVATRWPAQSKLIKPAFRPLLLIFAHPRCSCTEATLDDLERLLARCDGKLDVVIAFVRPPGTPAGWEQGTLWRKAAAIPDVKVLCDAGGIESQRFGAATSGQAFLYDAAGRLVFKGGLTAARGHAGDNDGTDTILTIVDGGRPTVRITPVYGCGLLNQPSHITAGVSP